MQEGHSEEKGEDEDQHHCQVWESVIPTSPLT